MITYQFDHAVTFFGSWIEGKLEEYDTQLKQPKYTLSELLDSNVKKKKSGHRAHGSVPGMEIIQVD